MVEHIIRAIRGARVNLSDEKQTQVDIAQVFEMYQIRHEREYRLSAQDIPDFMIGEIAVEVKLRGARKKDVYRQLERYAAHERVKAIILATNLTMGLPETINGKACYFVALGRAWI